MLHLFWLELEVCFLFSNNDVIRFTISKSNKKGKSVKVINLKNSIDIVIVMLSTCVCGTCSVLTNSFFFIHLVLLSNTPSIRLLCCCLRWLCWWLCWWSGILSVVSLCSLALIWILVVWWVGLWSISLSWISRCLCWITYKFQKKFFFNKTSIIFVL